MKKWDIIWIISFGLLLLICVKSYHSHQYLQSVMLENSSQLEQIQNYYERLAVNRSKLAYLYVGDLQLRDTISVSNMDISPPNLFFYYRDQNCEDCVVNASNFINALPDSLRKLVNVLYETDNPRKYVLSTSIFNCPKFYTTASGRFQTAANDAFFFRVNPNGQIIDVFYPSRFNQELIGNYLQAIFINSI